MAKVITIGRQFGSAGHDIGELIAKELGFKFYDKELVEMAAKKENISADTINEADEKATSSLLYSLSSGSLSLRGVSGLLYYEMPLNDKLFIVQSNIIKAVAKKGNCVIVGRCADYVLENEEGIDLYNVFVHAPLEFRTARVMEALGLSEKQAREKVIKIDKQRKTYYNYYSNRDWGKLSNYDIVVNTYKLGIENSAKFIAQCIKETNG
jgi:cytidylate kinase